MDCTYKGAGGWGLWGREVVGAGGGLHHPIGLFGVAI